ncbi:MAG: TIGR02678 family protein [Myxococcaceae bacterium]
MTDGAATEENDVPVEDAIGGGPPELDENGSIPNRRRHWAPEAGTETAAVLRLLAVRPWLVSGRDDESIAAVRRNLSAVRDGLARLGWVLVVERDLVRLRKSPPVRRGAWAASGLTPLQASWFFLLVAGAESVARRVGLAQLVTAARAAAAEAGLPVQNDITERRAIVRALRMLDERGVIEQVDGEVEGFVNDENAPVLIAVHHSRVAHVIANYGTADPKADPAGWLEQVEREPDPARRMRRRLIDDTVIHAVDLDEAEADWLSRRVRGDDGAPLASAFGLHLERRTEGAAFVVPDDAFRYPHELGPTPFPAPGTVPHAALLVCERAAVAGVVGSIAYGPGPGWRGLGATEVVAQLIALAAELPDGRGGWRRELVEDPNRLAGDVRSLLVSLDMVRVRSCADRESEIWWFSPASGRWACPPMRAGAIASGRQQQKGGGDRTRHDASSGKTLPLALGTLGPRSSE